MLARLPGADRIIHTFPESVPALCQRWVMLSCPHSGKACKHRHYYVDEAERRFNTQLRENRENKLDMDALLAAKAHLEANDVEVLGPTHHGIFKSIYFFDPNGHRIELACDIGTDEQMAELRRVAPLMLDEWNQTKRAPRHAAWLHEMAADANAG